MLKVTEMTNEEIVNLAKELGWKSDLIIRVDGLTNTEKVANYFVLLLIQNWLIKNYKLIVAVTPSIVPEWIKFNYRIIDGSLGRFNEISFSMYDWTDHKEALQQGVIQGLNYLKEKHERATQASN